MRLIALLMGLSLLYGCVTREYRTERVTEQPPSRSVTVVPGPQGPPGPPGPAGDTTIVVPRQ